MFRICILAITMTNFTSIQLKSALRIYNFFAEFCTEFAQIWICYLWSYSMLGWSRLSFSISFLQSFLNHFYTLYQSVKNNDTSYKQVVSIILMHFRIINPCWSIFWDSKLAFHDFFIRSTENQDCLSKRKKHFVEFSKRTCRELINKLIFVRCFAK